jgi:dihydroorotate dehydrogenase (NAD+) catalytic subunit
VQVGTATFYDPRAPVRVAAEMAAWCARHGVGAVTDVVGTLTP